MAGLVIERGDFGIDRRLLGIGVAGYPDPTFPANDLDVPATPSTTMSPSSATDLFVYPGRIAPERTARAAPFKKRVTPCRRRTDQTTPLHRVREFWERVRNAHEPDAADRFLTEDFVLFYAREETRGRDLTSVGSPTTSPRC